jgi:hypothetical protein
MDEYETALKDVLTSLPRLTLGMDLLGETQANSASGCMIEIRLGPSPPSSVSKRSV